MEESIGLLIIIKPNCCVQEGGSSELHIAGPRAAGSPLKFQNSHIVGHSCAEDVCRNKKCHLRASGWPVTTHVETVDPYLSLEKYMRKLKIITFLKCYSISIKIIIDERLNVLYR